MMDPYTTAEYHDGDSGEPSQDQEKKIRREIANSNERRRMQSINSGFQSLRTLLPHHEGEKLSKAAILQQTAEYIYSLEQEKTRLLAQNCQLKRLLSLSQQQLDTIQEPAPPADPQTTLLATASPLPAPANNAANKRKRAAPAASTAPAKHGALENEVPAPPAPKTPASTTAAATTVNPATTEIHLGRLNPVPEVSHTAVAPSSAAPLSTPAPPPSVIVVAAAPPAPNSSASSSNTASPPLSAVAPPSIEHLLPTVPNPATPHPAHLPQQPLPSTKAANIEATLQKQQPQLNHRNGPPADSNNPLKATAASLLPTTPVPPTTTLIMTSAVRDVAAAAAVIEKSSQAQVRRLIPAAPAVVPPAISLPAVVAKAKKMDQQDSTEKNNELAKNRSYIVTSTSKQNLDSIVEAIRHLEGDHLFSTEQQQLQQQQLQQQQQQQQQQQVDA